MFIIFALGTSIPVGSTVFHLMLQFCLFSSRSVVDLLSSFFLLGDGIYLFYLLYGQKEVSFLRSWKPSEWSLISDEILVVHVGSLCYMKLSETLQLGIRTSKKMER